MTKMTLNVVRFLVCSSDDEFIQPEPRDSLDAAIEIKTLKEKQSMGKLPIWEILAEISVEQPTGEDNGNL